MELRYLRLALACVKLNLSNLKVGVNVNADNYLKVYNNWTSLTECVADAILDMHETDVARMRFIIFDYGDRPARGDQLRGRGSC